MSRTIKFQTDLGREKSASFYRQGSRFWPFSLRSRVGHALRYVLIGQKLTGEFMRKIYAASWNLFTDSWNWQGFV